MQNLMNNEVYPPKEALSLEDLYQSLVVLLKSVQVEEQQLIDGVSTSGTVVTIHFNYRGQERNIEIDLATYVNIPKKPRAILNLRTDIINQLIEIGVLPEKGEIEDPGSLPYSSTN